MHRLVVVTAVAASLAGCRRAHIPDPTVNRLWANTTAPSVFDALHLALRERGYAALRAQKAEGLLLTDWLRMHRSPYCIRFDCLVQQRGDVTATSCRIDFASCSGLTAGTALPAGRVNAKSRAQAQRVADEIVGLVHDALVRTPVPLQTTLPPPPAPAAP